MVAQCRLGQGEIGENITGGHFLAGKHINDAETRFVRQRFENGGKFFVTRFVIHKILFPRKFHKQVSKQFYRYI